MTPGLFCPISAAARKYPKATAYSDGQTHAYVAMAERIERCQTALHDLGVRQGDRVLLLGVPSVAWCGALWAVFRTGGMACPINPGLPFPEISRIARMLRPSCILYDDVGRDAAHGLALKNLAFSELDKTAMDSVAPAWDAILNPDSPATVILTSGSSGSPKAAVHTLGNHLASAHAANRNLPLAPGDCWLLSLPLFHVSGLAVLFRTAAAGASVALPAPDNTLETELVRLRPTHISLVPTQLKRLLDTDEGTRALAAMKGVLLGGAPASDALIRRAFQARIPLVRSYGMTETSAQICATAPGASLAELRSSGRALTAGTVRIASGSRIEVCGSTIFKGYFSAAGEIEKSETPDGWFVTGDCGHLDEEGLLFVTGRSDAMFISGGENIYPEEIEQALLNFPEVSQAAVVDVPHPEYGSVPVAFVKTTDGCVPDGADMRRKLLETLPGYKAPRVVLPWPEGIASRAIKPSRAALRAEAMERLGGQV